MIVICVCRTEIKETQDDHKYANISKNVCVPAHKAINIQYIDIVDVIYIKYTVRFETTYGTMEQC